MNLQAHGNLDVGISSLSINVGLLNLIFQSFCHSTRLVWRQTTAGCDREDNRCATIVVLYRLPISKVLQHLITPQLLAYIPLDFYFQNFQLANSVSHVCTSDFGLFSLLCIASVVIVEPLFPIMKGQQHFLFFTNYCFPLCLK